MNKNKFYGIQRIVINDTRVYTLNITIKPSSMILSKVIKDPVWKDKHTLGMKNGHSTVNFIHTSMDENEFNSSVKRLRNILFAHKVNKLMNDNPWTIDKENIIKEVLNQIEEERDNFIL
jgi:hypothetical protein